MFKKLVTEKRAKEEWNTFMTNLKAQGSTTSNDSSLFGLSRNYWSSSQNDLNSAWYVDFYYGGLR